MKLYHFTALQFLGDIRLHGLTRGFVPVNDSPIKLLPGMIWLTTNSEWQQEWAEGTGRLPYRRDEVRLTVDIPRDSEPSILKWSKHGRKLSQIYDVLSAFGDPENWHLFRGRIPPEWIVAEKCNPMLTILARR